MKIFLALALLVAILFGFYFVNWQASFIKNAVYNWVGRPVFSGFNFFGEKFSKVNMFFSGLLFNGQEKKDLESIISILRSQNVRLREVVRENKFLKERLNISGQNKNEFILAKVVAKDQSATNSVLIVDKGRQDGVIVGQAVILGPSILLGSVFETQDKFSKIRLLSDPQSSVNVIIQDKDLQGVVTGQYGLSLMLQKVPWKKRLEPGDKIVSSGLGKDFPSGLFVGEVAESAKDQSAVYQSVRVTPAAEIGVLDFVFIFK